MQQTTINSYIISDNIYSLAAAFRSRGHKQSNEQKLKRAKR